MLFQEGPNYARESDKIPEEPGILKAGTGGAGMPTCIYCPDPDYSGASRAEKFQGVVVLSIVVTSEGKLDSILRSEWSAIWPDDKSNRDHSELEI